MHKQIRQYLALQAIGLEACEEYSLNREGFYFVLPKAGSGRYIAGSQILSLTPGDVLAVKGRIGGRMRAERTEWHIQAFCLCLEHLFPLFAGHEIALLQRVMEGFGSPKIWPATSEAGKECGRLAGEIPEKNNLEHRTQLLRIAGTLLDSEFEKAQRQQMGVENGAERMLDVFDKLSTEELLSLSAGEMAAKFGCSRRHLNRLFHRFLGQSVGALRTEMRLLRATSLLRNPHLKVSSVAGQCGFNHLGLFNSCFRKRFGLSPGEWRKRALRQDGEFPEPKRENALGLPHAQGLFEAPEGAVSLVTPAHAALFRDGLVSLRIPTALQSDPAFARSAA